MDSNVKKWSAEFIGTFWLTFGGCGSAVLAAAAARCWPLPFRNLASAFMAWRWPLA